MWVNVVTSIKLIRDWKRFSFLQQKSRVTRGKLFKIASCILRYLVIKISIGLVTTSLRHENFALSGFCSMISSSTRALHYRSRWKFKAEENNQHSLFITHLQANWQTAHQECLRYRLHHVLDVYSAEYARRQSDTFGVGSMKSSSKKMSYSSSLELLVCFLFTKLVSVYYVQQSARFLWLPVTITIYLFQRFSSRIHDELPSTQRSTELPMSKMIRRNIFFTLSVLASYSQHQHSQ